MPPREKTIKPMVSEASCRAVAGSLLSSLEYTGRNAAESAPSPKRRRNRFGSMNANQNASVIAVTPKMRDSTASRARPVRRLANVSNVTVRACFSKRSGMGALAGLGPTRSGCVDIGIAAMAVPPPESIRKALMGEFMADIGGPGKQRQRVGQFNTDTSYRCFEQLSNNTAQNEARGKSSRRTEHRRGAWELFDRRARSSSRPMALVLEYGCCIPIVPSALSAERLFYEAVLCASARTNAVPHSPHVPTPSASVGVPRRSWPQLTQRTARS